MCADLNEAGVQKTVEKITAAIGPNLAIGVKVDISKEDQVKNLVDTAVSQFGKASENLWVRGYSRVRSM